MLQSCWCLTLTRCAHKVEFLDLRFAQSLQSFLSCTNLSNNLPLLTLKLNMALNRGLYQRLESRTLLSACIFARAKVLFKWDSQNQPQSNTSLRYLQAQWERRENKIGNIKTILAKDPTVVRASYTPAPPPFPTAGSCNCLGSQILQKSPWRTNVKIKVWIEICEFNQFSFKFALFQKCFCQVVDSNISEQLDYNAIFQTQTYHILTTCSLW